MCRYRVEVGHDDDVKPGNLVGAIANEADIDSCYIGAIDIFDNFSTIDLPAGMPKETFRILKNTRVCGRKINISELKASGLREYKKSANSKPDSKNRKPVRKSGGKKTEARNTIKRKKKNPEI
ncbi:ATP-dependent RNA helicase DeaD [bacterium BMS3Bbin11]|nr:ATP-dependent RNA helicase DeaD [bacterium BMS3Bbin11]